MTRAKATRPVANAAERTLARSVMAAMGIVLGGCSTIPPNPQASATSNTCPSHPCDVYEQEGGAPACNAGVCTVAADPVGLLLVIDLAEDSIIAPGRTYLTTLERDPVETGACALQDCRPPTCALLPWVQDTNLYLIDPAPALEVGWYLGNPGVANPTALPVQAIYRPLLGASMADAIDLGLPVDPVQGLNVSSGAATFYKGPNGAPALEFEAYMQAGCYERTLQPYSPLSSAFPPEIKPWTVANAGGFDTVADFDPTTEETGLPTGAGPLPTFTISRAAGLDGWTAYLRSIDSKRIYSNVASLHGSLSPDVILATRHLVGTGDALDGLELVVAPPTGTPLPTEVLAPVGTPPSQELPAPETYPSLPLPVTLTGRIESGDGTPVPATVVFTASDIFDRTGQPFPPNFEFTTEVTTTTDAPSGASTYSVTLPQGDYVVAVRPADTSSAVALSTRTVAAPADPRADAGADTLLTADLTVSPLVPLAGSVLVADSRPLTSAIVEVVPTACASLAGADGSAGDASVTQAFSVASASDTCMPRTTQSITAADGTFSLALDPGSYLLRVRPVDGSHLPWMKQSLLISPGSASVALPPIRIPAPISFGMVLTDTVGNVAANAVVRAFTDPSQGGPAVEVGRAITDSTGYYEMFLASPLP